MPAANDKLPAMLHYFRFRRDLFAPTPAKDVYIKRGAGKGWPEECPPIRAANGFGYDVLANFDLTFIRKRGGGWKVKNDVIIESDFNFSASEDSEGAPLTQQYAWFWQRGQKLPHVISDNVYGHIQNQVKVSSFLYLRTDPNELLYFTDIPNVSRPWRTMSALVDADWYPASYCWHIVLELNPAESKIHIPKGEPIGRIFTVRRDTYFAREMSPSEFDEFFDRGQNWLSTHGRPHEQGDEQTLDITRTYVRQQIRSKFVVS